jgi:hypothetical protein
VVDVGGAINHGDHGDHCLQPVGGLHLAEEGKLGALFHEAKTGVVVFFLACAKKKQMILNMFSRILCLTIVISCNQAGSAIFLDSPTAMLLPAL